MELKEGIKGPMRHKRTARDEQVRARRELLKRLWLEGVSAREMTERAFAESLLPSSNFESGYRLIRKDLSRIMDHLDAEVAERLPGAKPLYVARQESIFRHAFETFIDDTANPGLRAACARVAIEAATRAARAQGVAVDPRYDVTSKGEKIDLASAAALAIIKAYEEEEKENRSGTVN